MGEGEFVDGARRARAFLERRRRGDVSHPARTPGLPLAPVAQTASGGELSRIALAIAAVGGGATMIFDEIDAGIGGQTAHAVADTLVRLVRARAGRRRSRTCRRSRAAQSGTSALRRCPAILRIRASASSARTSGVRRSSVCSAAASSFRRLQTARADRQDEMATRPRAQRTRARARDAVELTGRARLDRRTKHLVRRLSADDVAIIDHADLDRVSAEELVESGVRVVVNVSPSSSGRYPNRGPLTLLRGGVRLVDAPGAPLFEQLSEGEWVTVRGGSILRNGERMATGRVLDELELVHALDEQQARLAEAISSFADNTMRYLRERGAAARGGHRVSGARDAVPGPPLPRGRARPGPQARPADRPRLHPELQAGARRRRRRCGRAA